MEKFEKYFTITIFLCLGICIGVSTLIHWLMPWIFQVPDFAPPTFSSSLMLDLILTDTGALVAAIIIFYYSYHKHGLWRSLLFLTGSFIFTGLEEAMWILSGRFGLVYPTYFFTKGGLWFFEVPFYTCIGWYVIAYSCVFLAEKIFPNRGHFFHAGLGAILAVDFDLWTDPVMVNLNQASILPADGGMWVWLMKDTLTIFGIPFMNFFGWFLVIFLFAILWKAVSARESQWGKKKATILFYICIPLLLGICLVALGGVEMLIIKNFFKNVSILPIPFG
ncbi:MAG: carotenoid biosynthesis protein [Candidatus Helarchaeota archaeon]